MASDRVNSCLYPRRDPDTACGYAHAVRADDTTEEGPVMASDRDTVAEATGLSLREHQVAAAECDVLADSLEHLAEIADGPLAANLASAYRSAALAVRGRAGRHRDPGVADPPRSSVVASAGHRMSDTREALRQIESALADMLETYAEMRSEYLNNANDDARQALGIEIDAYRSAARLVRAHRVEDSGMGLPSWRWHEWTVREREITDRLDEFLIIPRSDIVGTEYGVRYSEYAEAPAVVREDFTLEEAASLVRSIRWRQEANRRTPNAELLSRFNPPWSVIPLPEDGQ